MSVKSRINLYRNCYKRAKADLRQLSLGQKINYDLLQLSHRLEKGLLITNPKPMWGWDKAEKMVTLLKKCKDDFSSITAKAVLSVYLEAKSKSEYKEDLEKYAHFLRQTGFQTVPFENVGGTITVKSQAFSESERAAIRRLFDTRHSCREFVDRHVSDKDIEEAVRLALRCPSACNRQPFHVYAIDPAKLAKQMRQEKLQYDGDRVLIITGDVRAFSTSELLDWIVSPSIFAGYLTLSLHSLGIGSCVVRKDLVCPSAYNDAIRVLTGMDSSERIVLEIFIGYYPDEFVVPVSNRANSDNIVSFV